MKAVIQRVLDANLKVDGKLVSEIGQGYVIFLGVAKGDTKETADYFIKKIPSLRICEDENGKNIRGTGHMVFNWFDGGDEKEWGSIPNKSKTNS